MPQRLWVDHRALAATRKETERPMSSLKFVHLLAVVFLFFLLVSSALAQTDNDAMLPGSSYEVSGQVRSAGSKVIENVVVRLESSSGALVDQGTADSMGRFRFSRLRPGQYSVSAKAQGLSAPPQAVDVNRFNPRIYVMLQLVPETATFRPRGEGRSRVVDANVPVLAAAALEKGRAALADKKPDEAITYLQKAISIYPNFYEAHFLLGKLYMDGSQWEKAENALRSALKVDPKSVLAMASLGEVYRRQKKYGEGQKLLEAALKLDNNSWESNFTLGRIHWELKDIAKSSVYIARTIQLQPNLPEARLLAGNIFIRAGFPDNALIEYQEYLRLAPNGEFAAQVQALVDKLKKSLASK
jgi:Tfp pilus assembly protein PilF